MRRSVLRAAGEYPAADPRDVVEEIAGVRIVDPYRWLEQESGEVHAWQVAQAELASTSIAAAGGLVEARRLIEKYSAGSRPALPRRGGDRWFRAMYDATGCTVLAVAGSPYGEARELVRLSDFDLAGQPAVLSWLMPSPDGSVLAFGVCTDGSEHNHVHLVDVATGGLLEARPRQLLHSAWAGGVSWLADSSGFHYFALTGSAHDFAQAVFRYRLGDPDGTVEEVPVPEASREYTYVEASADGRWLVASHRVGSPIPVAVRDLAGGGPWRPFVTDCEGIVAGHVVGDDFVAVTDVDAPRGRLVAIPLAGPGDPSTWRELLPGSDAVLRSVEVVAGHLYISEFVDTVARVRVLTLDGEVVEELALPDAGALSAPFFPMTELSARSSPEEFLFAHASLVRSWGVYAHRPGEGVPVTLHEPSLRLDAEVDYQWAVSADGTRIPYHRVRPPGHMSSADAPTLVTAYGAAGIPTLPTYQPDLAAFVAAGGVVVQAYLRGGGEFGREWFRAADKERRAVRDADLVAVAEHLVSAGLAAPGRLALTGGSDGGLMCGVALTSRPELWAAVLPRAPLLDLIGGIRDPYLDFVIRKAWGDPEDPGDVRRLQAISPYERIVPADYPAVYVEAGAEDPRCPPWQARKFVARLQAAQQGESPILLHVWENAGHGAATSASVAADQDAEWLAFLAGALELPLSAPAAR